MWIHAAILVDFARECQ
jgi:hypothetical protein